MPIPTPKQSDQLSRARAIARRDGLRAIRGVNRHTGEIVWAVLSRSGTKACGVPCYHLVTEEAGRLRCDCRASAFGICAHRASVHALLATTRSAP